MASNHTPNINLSNWVLSDVPRMRDFNADNIVLDNILTDLKNKVNTLENEKRRYKNNLLAAVESVSDKYNEIKELVNTVNTSNGVDEVVLNELKNKINEINLVIENINNSQANSTDKIQDIEAITTKQKIKDIGYDYVNRNMTLYFHNKPTEILNLKYTPTSVDIDPIISKFMRNTYKNVADTADGIFSKNDIKEFTKNNVEDSYLNSKISAIVPEATDKVAGKISKNDINTLITNKISNSNEVANKIDEVVTYDKIKGLLNGNTTNYLGLNLSTSVDNSIATKLAEFKNTLNPSYKPNQDNTGKLLWNKNELTSLIQSSTVTVPEAEDTVDGIISKNEIKELINTSAPSIINTEVTKLITGDKVKELLDTTDFKDTFKQEVINNMKSKSNLEPILKSLSSPDTTVNSNNGDDLSVNPYRNTVMMWTPKQLNDFITKYGAIKNDKILNAIPVASDSTNGLINNNQIKSLIDNRLNTKKGREVIEKILLGDEYNEFTNIYNPDNENTVATHTFDRYVTFDKNRFAGVTYEGLTTREVPDYPNMTNYIRDNYISEVNPDETEKPKQDLFKYLNGGSTLVTNTSIVKALPEIKSYGQLMKPDVVFAQMFSQMRYNSTTDTDESIALRFYSPKDLTAMINRVTEFSINNATSNIADNNRQEVQNLLRDKVQEFNNSVTQKLNTLKNEVKTEIGTSVDNLIATKMQEVNNNIENTVTAKITDLDPGILTFEEYESKDENKKYVSGSIIHQIVSDMFGEGTIEGGYLRKINDSTSDESYGVITLSKVKSAAGEVADSKISTALTPISSKITTIERNLSGKLNSSDLSNRVDAILVGKNYLTTHQNLDHKLDKAVYERDKDTLVKTTDITDVVRTDQLNSLATKQELNQKVNQSDLESAVGSILSRGNYATDATLAAKLDKDKLGEEVDKILTAKDYAGSLSTINNKFDNYLTTSKYDTEKTNFVTKNELASKGYLTEHQNIDHKLNISDLNSKVEAILVNKTYATTSQLNNKLNKNELNQKVDQILNSKGYLVENTLNDKVNRLITTGNYVTNSIVDQKIAAARPDLTLYYNKDQVNNMLTNKAAKNIVDGTFNDVELRSDGLRFTKIDGTYKDVSLGEYLKSISINDVFTSAKLKAGNLVLTQKDGDEITVDLSSYATDTDLQSITSNIANNITPEINKRLTVERFETEKGTLEGKINAKLDQSTADGRYLLKSDKVVVSSATDDQEGIVTLNKIRELAQTSVTGGVTEERVNTLINNKVHAVGLDKTGVDTLDINSYFGSRIFTTNHSSKINNATTVGLNWQYDSRWGVQLSLTEENVPKAYIRARRNGNWTKYFQLATKDDVTSAINTAKVVINSGSPESTEGVVSKATIKSIIEEYNSSKDYVISNDFNGKFDQQIATYNRASHTGEDNKHVMWTKNQIKEVANTIDLSSYETKTHAEQTYAKKGEIPSLANYALKSELPNLSNNITTANLSSKVNEILATKGYAVGDLTDYVTNSSLRNQLNNKLNITDLTTRMDSHLSTKHYLTVSEGNTRFAPNSLTTTVNQLSSSVNELKRNSGTTNVYELKNSDINNGTETYGVIKGKQVKDLLTALVEEARIGNQNNRGFLGMMEVLKNRGGN